MLKLIQTCQITVLTDTESEMYINVSIQKDKQFLYLSWCVKNCPFHSKFLSICFNSLDCLVYSVYITEDFFGIE